MLLTLEAIGVEATAIVATLVAVACFVTLLFGAVHQLRRPQRPAAVRHRSSPVRQRPS